MEHQGPRRYAFIRVLVAGKDITDRLAPYLISVQVISTAGAEHDMCNLELDDRNGELAIPPDGARIQVVMGWRGEGPRPLDEGKVRIPRTKFEDTEAPFGGPGPQLVFSGKVANVESGFGRRGGGRRLWIEASGGDAKGPAKEHQNQTIGEGKKDEELEGGLGPLGPGVAAAGSLGGTIAGGVIGAVTGAFIGGPLGAFLGAAAGATIVGSTATPPAPGSPEAIAAAAAAAAAADPPVGPGGLVTSTIGKIMPPDQAGVFREGKIPLQEAATKFFGKAGMTIKLSPEMMKIRRDFWEIRDESPQAWAQRIATEVGGIFKISGNVGAIVGANEGVNADGEQMEKMEAIWGVNLIGWRIKPYIARPQWDSAAMNVFDVKNAVWDKEQGQTIGGSGPFGGNSMAVQWAMASAVDKNVASQLNQGAKTESESKRGTGWVLFNGDPRAKAGGYIQIIRARPGIDGEYRMSEVEHNYQRGVGYTTRANVQFPVYFKGGYGWGNDPGRGPVAPPEPRIPTSEEVPRVGPGAQSLALAARRRAEAEELARIKRYEEERKAGFPQ